MENAIVQPPFCETCKLTNLRIQTSRSHKKVGVLSEDVQLKKNNQIFQTEWLIMRLPHHFHQPEYPD